MESRDGINRITAIYRRAVSTMRPDRLLAETDPLADARRDPEAYRRIILAAVGKAALPFSSLIGKRVPGERLSGCIVVPNGYARSMPADLEVPSGVDMLEAGHPIPDAAGMRASHRVLEVARAAGPDDLLVGCLSGGGSALVPGVPPELSLDAVVSLHKALVTSGAPIGDINTVRRAVSTISGGRLAAAASPAEIVGLVLSDVAGDDPATIASSPLTASPTDANDALDVLCTWAVDTPPAIVAYLENGGTAQTGISAPVRIIGSNRDLLEAAVTEATRTGLRAVNHGSILSGEARKAGLAVVQAALSDLAAPPVLHVWGGETTVRVQGHGVGGRCQELALSAGEALMRSGVAADAVSVLAAGSDGRDGPTDAAGAALDSSMMRVAVERGLDPERALATHDAYPFLDAIGALIRTGATHTNVMDVVLLLRTA